MAVKNIIIAPDSFKGSLTAIEAANAIEEGVKSVFPHSNSITMPIADGGEGTMNILVSALKGEKISLKVHDPLMREITTEYGILNNGKTAIIEMAKASGITLLTKEEYNPLKTTTFGTGEIIKDALLRGCKTIMLGIGGSATNDAGTGMLRALGYRFLDKNGKETYGTGENLHSINIIDDSALLSELKNVEFIVACDVNNPFSGKNGAAFVYAPQKGADINMINILDEGLESFRLLVEKEKNIKLNTISGTGAAGGLGGGLLAFLNAQLKPGIEMVLDAVDFDIKLEKAELVITGEGKLDKQTGMGKAASGILKASKKRNVPVIAIGGSVEDIDELNKQGFTSVFSIIPYPMSLIDAMKTDTTKRNITQTTEQAMRVIKSFYNNTPTPS